MKTSKLKKRIRRLQQQLKIALDPPRSRTYTPGVEVLIDGVLLQGVREVYIEPGAVEKIDCTTLDSEFSEALLSKRMHPRVLIYREREW